MTQDQLGEQLGISASMLCKIEKEKLVPSPEVRAKIALVARISSAAWPRVHQ